MDMCFSRDMIRPLQRLAIPWNALLGTRVGSFIDSVGAENSAKSKGQDESVRMHACAANTRWRLSCLADLACLSWPVKRKNSNIFVNLFQGNYSYTLGRWLIHPRSRYYLPLE
jgi:hypothetical protein